MSTSETILITGGAGFIGSHVARRLQQEGYSVVIIDNFNQYYDSRLKEARVTQLLKNQGVRLYRGDITDYAFVKSVFDSHSIDRVIHLAAQAGVRYCLENPYVYTSSNVAGTLTLLEVVKSHPIKGFIFASSSSVYGNNTQTPFCEDHPANTPVSLYAATKLAAEHLVHSYHTLYKIPATGLRYFTVYGPWGRPDMAFFKFTDQILKGKPIEVYGQGEMKRDFTYIDDIVEGTLAALRKNYDWEIINLGFGNPIDLMDFIRVIEEAVGATAQKVLLPMQKGDVTTTYADIAKAERLLNWKPKTNIRQGMQQFVEWYKRHYSAG